MGWDSPGRAGRHPHAGDCGPRPRPPRRPAACRDGDHARRHVGSAGDAFSGTWLFVTAPVAGVICPATAIRGQEHLWRAAPAAF